MSLPLQLNPVSNNFLIYDSSEIDGFVVNIAGQSLVLDREAAAKLADYITVRNARASEEEVQKPSTSEDRINDVLERSGVSTQMQRSKIIKALNVLNEGPRPIKDSPQA